MTETNQFLVKHGAPIVFAAVYLEQIGLPLPALPWLLAAGALAAASQFNAWQGVVLGVAACLSADAIWFYLGRRRGNQVLGFLCRISLEPDSCVRRTQNVFARYGWKGIVVAKFLPGLNTVTPPLAGMSRMNAAHFFMLDCIGAVLYVGSFLALGYFFSSQIGQVGAAIASFGGGALGVMGLIVCGYVAFKYWQRKRVLNELRMARVTVDDLRQMQEAGADLVILDMRSKAALDDDPAIIPGAIHLTVDDVKERRYQIPAGREVVVYCSCPNEITAARVALLLRRHGFTHVRPLLGGIDAWRKENYPLGKLVALESINTRNEGRTHN